ncbi:MAG TPA: regulatory protein RecX [Bacteriovoracaceae bacterium]|nr:regulatory protein RecX [Bacteriovoracaceae bacterium]
MNQRIYNYSIHLIARQDYSAYKLRQKLLSKPDNSKEEVDEVIEALKEKGYINEEAYKRLFVRKWMFKGESEDKIRRRGAQEKLTFTSEDFMMISQELGFNDDDSLQKLVAKKLRSKEIPSDFKERQKLQDKILRFLISKGHDYSDAKDEIQKYFKGETRD